jgi:hypothetical protein
MAKQSPFKIIKDPFRKGPGQAIGLHLPATTHTGLLAFTQQDKDPALGLVGSGPGQR